MGVLKLFRNGFIGQGKMGSGVNISHSNLRRNGWINPTWIQALYSSYCKHPMLCSMEQTLKIECNLTCNHSFTFSLFWISLTYEFILINPTPTLPPLSRNQQISLWVMASFASLLCRHMITVQNNSLLIHAVLVHLHHSVLWLEPQACCLAFCPDFL